MDGWITDRGGGCLYIGNGRTTVIKVMAVKLTSSLADCLINCRQYGDASAAAAAF